MDSSSINAFKSILVYISGTTRWAFSWTSQLSPRPYWLDDLLLRLHKVYGHFGVKPMCTSTSVLRNHNPSRFGP